MKERKAFWEVLYKKFYCTFEGDENILPSVIKKIILLLGIVAIIVFPIVGYNAFQPIPLTEEEIETYTSVAEDIWFKGLNHIEIADDLDISIEVENETIKIHPNQVEKYSIWFSFNDVNKTVRINTTYFFKILHTMLGIMAGLFSAICIDVICKMVVIFIKYIKRRKSKNIV